MDSLSTGSNSPQLDEDLDEQLDEEINTTEKELKNIEEPDEMNIKRDIDPQKMEEFYEAIKKMPREKVIQLLANLGKDTNFGNNKFKDVSNEERLTTKERYHLKLNSLKSRRQSSTILKELEKRREKKMESEKKTDTLPVIEETTEKTVESTKQSKSQRRRHNTKLKSNVQTETSDTTHPEST